VLYFSFHRGGYGQALHRLAPFPLPIPYKDFFWFSRLSRKCGLSTLDYCLTPGGYIILIGRDTKGTPTHFHRTQELR